MFEVSGCAGTQRVAAGPGVPVTAAEVSAWTAALLGVAREATDGERIDLLGALEELTCAAAGAQAVVSADFDTSQRAVQAAAGVRTERQGRGVACQVALARRESPYRGQQHLGLAKVLTSEMPHTLAALRMGRITEWRATIVVRETACLSRADRITADRALAGDHHPNRSPLHLHRTPTTRRHATTTATSSRRLPPRIRPCLLTRPMRCAAFHPGSATGSAALSGPRR